MEAERKEEEHLLLNHEGLGLAPGTHGHVYLELSSVQDADRRVTGLIGHWPSSRF